jgi:AraC-like DNA-binding protein
VTPPTEAPTEPPAEPPAIQQIVFRSDKLPAAQLKDHLRERFSANFELDFPRGPLDPQDPRPSPDSQGGGSVEHRGFMLGELAMMQRSFFFSHSVLRTSASIRSSQVDHYCLNLPLRQASPFALRDPSGEARGVKLRTPLFLDMSRPYRMDFVPGEDISVFIPRDALDALLPKKVDLHGFSPQGISGRLLGEHLCALATAAPVMTQPEVQAAARATFCMMAASVAPTVESMALARPQFEQLFIRQIKRYVDANLGDSTLGAERLCAQFGMSRSALYRLLEPVGGVNTFVRERRLGAVHALLAAPQKRIYLARVADDFGFKSAAHFSRAFRQQFGYSPSEVGSQAMPAMAPVTKAQAAGQGFAGWLNQLQKH